MDKITFKPKKVDHITAKYECKEFARNEQIRQKDKRKPWTSKQLNMQDKQRKK